MHRPGLLGIVALLSATSCLFETTPPVRPPGSNDSGPNPNSAIVTGLVQLYDRQDRDATPARGWYLSVTWYRADTNGDGRLDVLYRSVVQAGQDGVYRAEYASPLVVRVEIAPRVCVVDLDVAGECCLEDPPCTGPACVIWLPAMGTDVLIGQRVQRNVVVRCDFVP